MNSSYKRLGLGALAVVFLAGVPMSAFAQNAAPAAGAAAPAAAAQKRPDLNGIWGGGVAQLTPIDCKAKSIDAFANNNDPRFTFGGAKGGAQWITFEQDCGVQHRDHVSKPQYKPQYWERVFLSDYHADAGGVWIDYADPQWQNYPVGVPRIGAPNKIVQTDNEVIFLYEAGNTFRAIPTDCRDFDPVLRYDQMVNGLAVGCWKDDVLTVTSVGFTDRTWLDWPGYIHSNEMTVIETFQRKGDQLIYQVTVDDPVMFLEPWKDDARTLNLNKDPKTQLMQDVPYNDRALGALVDPEYRG